MTEFELLILVLVTNALVFSAFLFLFFYFLRKEGERMHKLTQDFVISQLSHKISLEDLIGCNIRFTDPEVGEVDVVVLDANHPHKAAPVEEPPINRPLFL